MHSSLYLALGPYNPWLLEEMELFILSFKVEGSNFY